MLPDPEFAPTQCLDALEANLKSLLLRTGSVLSQPANLDATNITLTKDRLRRTLPVALDNFHRALGDLELSLTRARSVLYRDYAVLQQQSAKTTQDDQGAVGNGILESAKAMEPNDISMSDAEQPAILSHAVGPPTPPRDDESMKLSVGVEPKDGEGAPTSTLPASDDPLAHPKPVERQFQQVDKGTPNASASTKAQLGSDEPNGTNKQVLILGGSETKENGEKKSADTAGPKPQGDSSAAQQSDNSKQLSDAPNQATTKEGAAPSNSQSEDVSTLLPDLELYAQDESNGNSKEDNFNIDDFASSNTFAANGQDGAANNAQNEDNDINTDLPDDFLQSNADNGMSFDEQFDEQFDFGGFDFDNVGDGDSADGGGTNESNFFDDSLFNLDGDTGE